MSPSPSDLPQSLPTPEHTSPPASAGSLPAFVPRPFPPPALEGIPVEYVIHQLHRLGPQYWFKPQTADCTIIIPLTDGRRRSQAPTFGVNPTKDDNPLHTGPLDGSNTRIPDGRRASAPNIGPGRDRLTLRLHQDYLSAQSMFLRALFSGASPLDLTSTTSTNPILGPPTSRFAPGALPVPEERLPRLLPSGPTHPVVFLPLPDPPSFPHILIYLYFGNTSIIEHALNTGRITWEGIVRNVEYLGLRVELKVFLGRWYGHWRKDRPPQDDFIEEESEDGDTELDWSSDFAMNDENSDSDDLDTSGRGLGLVLDEAASTVSSCSTESSQGN